MRTCTRGHAIEGANQVIRTGRAPQCRECQRRYQRRFKRKPRYGDDGVPAAMLPAAPLQNQIKRDIERARLLHVANENTGGMMELARRTGFHERRLNQILRRQTKVTLDTADTYCTRAGHLLQDLYPDLYE